MSVKKISSGKCMFVPSYALSILDLYYAQKDWSPAEDDTDGISLTQGQIVEVLDSTTAAKRPRLDGSEDENTTLSHSAARHKIAIRPKRKYPSSRQRSQSPDVTSPIPSGNESDRWLVRTRPVGTIPSQQGYVPSSLLVMCGTGVAAPAMTASSPPPQVPTLQEDADAFRKERESLIMELLETEEEYIRDMQHVIENYYRLLGSIAPQHINLHKETLFGNYKEIYEFHSGTLIDGLRYYAKEDPSKISRVFLRLERDFDKHSNYCQSEPAAQDLLFMNNNVREYFDVSTD
jgi:hypothetical protein